MQTVVSVFVMVILLIVATWVAIFGGVGALLSRARGGSGPGGLAWGTGLGPIGWLVILWITRVQHVPVEPDLSRTVSTSSSSTVNPSSPARWDPWNG